MYSRTILQICPKKFLASSNLADFLRTAKPPNKNPTKYSCYMVSNLFLHYDFIRVNGEYGRVIQLQLKGSLSD